MHCQALLPLISVQQKGITYRLFRFLPEGSGVPVPW